MTLAELERTPAFAVLGPGFFDDGRWRLFLPDDAGPHALWLAAFDERPRAHRGAFTPFTPDWHGVGALDVTLHDEGFETNVTRIRERIAAGDVYQVNLTIRATVRHASGSALLSKLCANAVPRFAAWVRLPGVGEFVSASPELLVETRAKWVHAEPMKGTAAPGQRELLEASAKDRAELAMITDLTRNDLQQLCVRGSVRVTAARRFIELPYVLQAVSDVEGVLRDDRSLGDVLSLMHPGGSVTGAPRPAALSVIHELEPTSRRFYCGTLGVETNEGLRAALLIRTATKLAPDSWEFGVGSGITWDSDPAAELEEVRLKLGALRGA
ncbi:MAG: chorismate-binding protein [Archangium sp.]|nr:chorismate-binding protein [Archangium sp.]